MKKTIFWNEKKTIFWTSKHKIVIKAFQMVSLTPNKVAF